MDQKIGFISRYLDGEKVAELRRLSSLTQEQLAEELGVSLKYAQRLEAGRENLTVRSMCRIAGYFNIGIRDLLLPPKDEQVSRGRPVRKAKVRKGAHRST